MVYVTQMLLSIHEHFIQDIQGAKIKAAYRTAVAWRCDWVTSQKGNTKKPLKMSFMFKIFILMFICQSNDKEKFWQEDRSQQDR